MPDYPSEAPTLALSQALPTRIPDPEHLVYEYVKAAAAFSLPAGRAALSFYQDAARALSEDLTIDVVQGWPVYPGVVPAIGVGSGTESQDQAQRTIQGGFVGEVTAYDDDDEVIGAADYFAMPLYIPVMAVLIHENRDERDRLHNQLRMVMTPLTTWLPLQDPLIKRVDVDGEKDEVASQGPDPNTAPFLIYTSTFTAHVYCEMLTPRNIVTADQIAGSFTVTPSVPD